MSVRKRKEAIYRRSLSQDARMVRWIAIALPRALDRLANWAAKMQDDTMADVLEGRR